MLLCTDPWPTHLYTSPSIHAATPELMHSRGGAACTLPPLANWRCCSDIQRLDEEPWRWEVGSQSLPPITLEQLDDAILAKSVGAALGWENVQARLLLKLVKACLMKIKLPQNWTT